MQVRCDRVYSNELTEDFREGGRAATLWGMDSVRFGRALWMWGSCGCQDAGDGGGCGDVAESFGWGQGKRTAVQMRVLLVLQLRLAGECGGVRVRLGQQAARTTAQVRQTKQG